MSRKESERSKQIQEKCQNLLTQMLRDDDNKYCVDCDAKGPRWASWNLGIFLCIRCAGIHRNLGVHISRVKSVNLDSWTPDQVVSLQQMGNSKARAVYEAQMPDGFRRPQTDSALDSFIRAKYEHKKYIAKEWIQPPAPKVDWDKEIDEEIEKQKKKKKSSSSSSSSSLGLSNPSASAEKKSASASLKTPLPAPLPKPKSSSNSPKISSRNTETPAVNNDLLGLSSPTNPKKVQDSNDSKGNNDSFSNFMSSPLPTSEAVKSNVNNNNNTNNNNLSAVQNESNLLAKEEADFFNQMPSDKDKLSGKLTKDNILALYGTAPSTNQMMGGFNAFNSPIQSGFNQIPGTVGSQPLNTGTHVQSYNNHFAGMTNTGMVNQNLIGVQYGGVAGQQFAQHQQNGSPGGNSNFPMQQNMNLFHQQPLPQQQQHHQQFNNFAQFQMQNNFSNQVHQSAPSTKQTNENNISNQFENLNLGNVWQ